MAHKFFLDFDAALRHLQDETAVLSPSALSALSNPSKPDLTAFAQVWARLPVERRRRVAQMLVELAEENVELDFNVLFRHLFNDQDAPVRARGIEGLWEDEDPGLIKTLIAFLHDDPDAGVRAAAAAALGRFVLLGEYERIPPARAALISDALLAVWRDLAEDDDVRCRALESLAYSSHTAVREVIAAAYAGAHAALRASAIVAMGRSADAYWRRSVENELESPEPRLRFYAARAAGELEDRAATPRLIELLDDADREVASAAITALGQIGGRQARRALSRVAASEDEALADLASAALQELEFSNDADLLLLNIETDADLDGVEPDADLDEEPEAETL